MRNAFVVLVSLCIGAATGRIAPSGDSKSTVATNVTQSKNEVNHISARVGILSDNRSDEKALYEHAGDKENVQNQRAFIYINQKYKKPSLHQFFRLAQNGPEFTRSFQLPPPIPQAAIQRLNDPCKSNSFEGTSYFQGYNLLAKSPDIASYFASSSKDVKCDSDHSCNYVCNDRRKIDNDSDIPRDRHDFIELLKLPLLKPVNKVKKPAKYDDIQGPHFLPVHYKDLFTQSTFKKPDNPMARILVDERKLDMRKNYGFSSPIRIKDDKEKAHKARDPNSDVEFVNEDSRVYEKNEDDDKSLEKYLEDTLEDQVTTKEKPINPNDCNYGDCFILSTKPSSSVGNLEENKKPGCSCGHSNSDTPKDRLEREGNTFRNCSMTTSSPVDTNYYQQMLTEDSNIENSNNNVKYRTENTT